MDDEAEDRTGSAHGITGLRELPHVQHWKGAAEIVNMREMCGAAPAPAILASGVVLRNKNAHTVVMVRCPARTRDNRVARDM